MRDYHKLRAFELADQLALAIYKCTKSFPKEEMFGLTHRSDELLYQYLRISLKAARSLRRPTMFDSSRLRTVRFAKLSITFAC